MNRCSWLNLDNESYVKYHDTEWGVPNYSDSYMYEFLVLESFQAGLSWETIINKRENFRRAFDNFDYQKVSTYDEQKIEELMQNPGIIRNSLKIKSAINNAKVFIAIQNEFGSFSNYIWSFTDHKVIRNQTDIFKTTSVLSDTVSKDLKKRGMTFVGSTIIYSYLQALGIIDDHELACCFRK